jgi:hypothetical protein
LLIFFPSSIKYAFSGLNTTRDHVYELIERQKEEAPRIKQERRRQSEIDKKKEQLGEVDVMVRNIKSLNKIKALDIEDPKPVKKGCCNII